MKFRMLMREIWRGNSLFRALMHKELSSHQLTGNVIDLGSGKKKSYAHRMPHSGTINLKTYDQKGTAETSPLDLENDTIPLQSESVDFVLLCNILEHIFNYQHALLESFRILKRDGTLIGFVPFFCHYHPGPRDFFRYTHEALEKMFLQAGFAPLQIHITSLGFGPASVCFHMIFLATNKNWRRNLRLLFMCALCVTLVCDFLFRRCNKTSVRDFPLGYKFVVKK